MTAPATFQVGHHYPTGGHDYVWTFTVTSRTAKFLTLREAYGDVYRVGVRTNHDGSEWALPLGRYANAPVIRAEREVTA